MERVIPGDRGATLILESLNSIWERVWEKVSERIWERVWERVWDRVWERVWERVWKRVWERIWKGTGNRGPRDRNRKAPRKNLTAAHFFGINLPRH